ncbi:MAG: bifunctional folylpolyglutamate synthase/dihydrofolate synthase [Longimicrobiales bacterium]
MNPESTDSLGPDPLIGALFPDSEWKVEWGLGRMERALEELDAPHLQYPCLHVGGTNGKGSVASVWASVLGKAGYRTGLYTSPHLCSFRERIVVNGEPASEARLTDVAAKLAPIFSRGGLSFFEASTLLAFECFRDAGVDVGIIEVGLGGRLDATNVVEPLVTAITNVAMDHQEYLGDSLLEIAEEKAGIIKAGVPVVTAERRPAVLEIFASRAQAVGATLHVLDPWEDISALQLGPDGTRFTVRTDRWGPLSLSTPLLGAHQATNAALAVRGLEAAFPDLAAESVVEGVASVQWPGRVQIRKTGDSLWVFDVAHNTAGVRALSAVLADLAPPRPLILLTGILGDKDWVQMLPPLLDAADHAIFTTPASAPRGRGWDPTAVAAEVGSGKPIEVVEEIDEAVSRAAALGVGGTVVVTGSCYTVGDALKLLGWAPYGP